MARIAIEVPDDEVEEILDGISMNLDYQVYETDYPREYADEIHASIAVLRIFGDAEAAGKYETAYHARVDCR